MSDTLELSPLDTEHQVLKAKMVPFAGYRMPIQYPTGIQTEHRAVREGVGLFDVSHMGEFEVEGPDALTLLRRVAVNDAGRLEVGQAQYSALCAEDGTVMDDLLVYRLAPDRFLLVVNASNRKEDLEWIRSHIRRMDVKVQDRSAATALVAIQGPRAHQILAPLTTANLDQMGYYRFAAGRVMGVESLVARTGYTGEDGFEIYHPAERATDVWRGILEQSRREGVVPAGLGARDTLRLEVGYPLYGNDLSREYTALESGLGWIVKFDKERGNFVGREALAREKEEGSRRRLTGIRLEERGFPRSGYPLVVDGEEVGVVTSGTLSPSLEQGIALGYLPTEMAKPGTQVHVRIRNRDVPAVVERPPFYKDGSIRR
ncbi:MAG: glycine cleavage system aminomethyltransferase GcvT [Gemmatimonadales bacterium]|nr:MAG: glycine cleavage system aminomethyltransferase GcvT [Gemmatimonadales bacterium]